uniref:Uncharacterized protein n=1 Tax=viral metagenome TaxID=1070528 RepID=A0A6C0C170_9ZZZZ
MSIFENSFRLFPRKKTTIYIIKELKETQHSYGNFHL